MSEILGLTSSIVAVVGFGLELATTLHSYVEAAVDGGGRLRDLAVDINATASALKQLQAIVEADQANTEQKDLKVFKDEGREEIEVLAVQCGKVYVTIIVVITKAGTAGWEGKLPLNSLDARKLRVSSLSRSVKWPWLRPRIKRCHEQLKWLKINLLFNLQLASLARFQIQTPQRLPGSFEEELALRTMLERLRTRKIKCTKDLAAKFKKMDESSSTSSETDTISTLHSVSGMSIEIAEPQPKLDDDGKEFTQSGGLTKGDADVMVTISDPDQDVVPLNRFPESGSEDNSEDKPVDEGAPKSPEPAASISTNETLVPDSEKEKEEIEKEREIIVEEQAHGPGHQVNDPQDKMNAKQSSSGCVEDGSGYRMSGMNDDDRKVEVVSLPAYESRFGGLSWLKDLFGRRDKFSRDWESPTLEAVIADCEAQTLLKLPFGHQRLTYGFKRLMKKNKGLSWDQYMSLDKQYLLEIDRVVIGAKLRDSRDRTCLAIDIQKKKPGTDAEQMLLFFSLGDPVEPVHLTDAVGRKFDFPFESCRMWTRMKRLIEQAFMHIELIGQHVLAGHYDLLIDSKTVVLPYLWEATVKPGCVVTMHMWPLPAPPRPPRLPPPPPPAWLRAPPPMRPPPPPWVRPRPGSPEIIVIEDTKRRCTSSVSSYSDSDDLGELGSDSEIEDDDDDLGIEVDFDVEEEKAAHSLHELLGRWTNATDVVGDAIMSEDDDSDSDSDSGSSYLSLLDD